MSSVDKHLRDALQACPGVNRFLVAFSGGMDSSVLLHALSGYASTRSDVEFRAVHVHHGLHADANEWTQHCRAVCAALHVPFEVFFARLEPVAGESVEAEARRARYQLLQCCMQPNDMVLMAHHGDDQMETMLMRLLRGAGARGIAGIPKTRRLGPGRLLRPLLELPRSELALYARQNQIDFLEDPSNSDLRFDRGYLRSQVIGPLQQRWPAAVRNAVRSARHLRAGADLLDDLAELDLKVARAAEGGLSVPAILRLSSARQHNLLRHWIRVSGFKPPSSARLAAVVSNVLAASHDAVPLVAWPGAELRRFRDRLYLMKPLPEPPVTWSARWDTRKVLMLPARTGRLRTLFAVGGGLDADILTSGNVSVQFRAGGERLRPAGCKHHTTLSRLFQERGVVPWMRARVPLVYVEGELAAVADLCWADGFSAADKGACVRLAWDGHPPI